MHDMKCIRENPEAFDEGLSCRNLSALSRILLDIDTKKREALTKLQVLQARRNEIATLIGPLKKDGKDCSSLETEATKIKSEIVALEAASSDYSLQLDEMLSKIPNIPDGSVPVGVDETANVCVRTVGDIPSFDFQPSSHCEIGESLGIVDFDSAVKISGSRFTILKSAGAKLERALKNFMLDIHTKEFGYTEVSVPFLVKTDSMYGTGQLPKFAEDSFQTTDGKWLISTAEIPLTNLVRETITNASDLPLRFTAYSACFRSEAGAAGKDTRGMIRNHQFSKVELVSIVHPEKGAEELERMTNAAETILKRLGLSYRVMLLSTGDMGFSAKKTYDLEVWVPSENKYREISSCSLCGDFQARRMGARYKSASEKGFVYTLNGSGLAIGRTIVAILENYQLSNGRVVVPDALVKYMNDEREMS